jgi:hypothetical protein
MRPQQPVPIISFLVDSYRLLMQASITIRRQQQAHASIEGVWTAAAIGREIFLKNLTSNAFLSRHLSGAMCFNLE